MNFLNRIVPKYSYDYFDMYNQLQSKQLNIFQCFARKAFGWYAETHLSKVVAQAYKVTLNDQFQAAPPKQQKLLKLIAKLESTHRYKKAWYTTLPNFALSDRSRLSIGVHYDIKKPDSVHGTYQISSINFKLIFGKNILDRQTYEISIFKNKSQRMVVRLPRELFLRFDKDTEDSIKKRLKSEYAKTISDLLAKILNDTSATTEMKSLQYYAPDYTDRPQRMYMDYIINGYHLSSDQNEDAKLNNAQEESMHQLGWKYIHQLPPSRRTGILQTKRVYQLTKEETVKNQNLTALGLQKQFSIAFAASLLETKTEEY